MNLENVTAELRPRGAWEAADLGARMVRRDAGAIYTTWFAVTLPLLFLATLAIVFLPYPGITQMLYWWCEPLVDGPILYVISRRLFGESTTAWSAIRATPALARRNWLFLLTPLRFHFARSIAVPVTQLEELSGARRRDRAKVLNKHLMNHGVGLTVAYQHLVICLYIGVVLVGFLFVPQGYQGTLGLEWLDTFFDAETDSRVARVLALWTFYIAQTSLHPWFVGAGFGLYIDCRTKLEAWDIEVAFRRMLQRRRQHGAVTALLACALLGWADPGVAAVETMEPYWDGPTVETARQRVFADERLQQTRIVTEWQRVDKTKERGSRDPGPVFRGLGRIAGIVTEFGLWLAVAALLVILFATRSRWLPYLRYTPEARSGPRRVVLDSGVITADQLPDDIPAAAQELWAAGKHRESLSLLYRGSVFYSVDQMGVRLPRSATEGECVDALDSQADGPIVDYFRNVVAAWVWCAYGGRTPADEVVNRLCGEWHSHYGVTA